MKQKQYTNLESVYKDWLTTKDLFKILEERGYAHDKHALNRWERSGIIPKAKRITFKGIPWRVYEKDGSDFREILSNLDNRPKRIHR